MIRLKVLVLFSIITEVYTSLFLAVSKKHKKNEYCTQMKARLNQINNLHCIWRYGYVVLGNPFHCYADFGMEHIEMVKRDEAFETA